MYEIMTTLEHNPETARFMAAMYLSDVRFSYLPGFATEVRGEISRAASSADELVAILARAGSAADPEAPLADGPAVRRHVEARDLRTIQEMVKDDRLAAVDFSPEGIHAEIVATCRRAVDILSAQGLTLGEPPDVLLVDRMPHPYDGKPSITALAVDGADEAEYGVAQGVYFQRSGLTPFYSQFIALHEMVHIMLGHRDPGRNAHGIEEGIADVLGSIWLSQLILGRELTRQLYVLNRLSSEYNPYSERYLDSARQAFALILIHGFEGTLEFLRGGRAELYRIEKSLLKAAPRTRIVADLGDDFMSLAWELLFTYPRSFVCSPAAFLFARQAHSGLTIREVAAQASRELRDEHGVLFLRKDGLVVLEGTPAIVFSEDWFRYDSR